MALSCGLERLLDEIPTFRRENVAQTVSLFRTKFNQPVIEELKEHSAEAVNSHLAASSISEVRDTLPDETRFNLSAENRPSLICKSRYDSGTILLIVCVIPFLAHDSCLFILVYVSAASSSFSIAGSRVTDFLNACDALLAQNRSTLP